jgi:hypothetical protein
MQPLICPAGSLCSSGASAPTICGAGGFCPAGVSASMPCPDSTFSTKSNQSTVAACSACSVCAAGTYQTGICSATHDVQCTACTGKPVNASYYSVCLYRCNDGYFGETCAPCPANSWCANEIQTHCPANSESPSLSTRAADCRCISGYSNTGSIYGLIQCVGCLPGSTCASGQTAAMVVSPTPLPNITQVILVQKPLPPADSTASLYASAPSLWLQISSLVKNVSVFTRQLCRGSYCVACDGTPTCVQRQSINVSVVGGAYRASSTSLQYDTLYQISAAAGACVPSFTGLDAEYFVDTQLAVTSNSGLSSVLISCPTDLSLQLVLSFPSRSPTRRSLRSLLSQTSDSISVSVVVESPLVQPTGTAISQANLTIEGYTTVNPPKVTCQPGDYFPAGGFTPMPCLAGSFCPGDGSIYSCQPGTQV